MWPPRRLRRAAQSVPHWFLSVVLALICQQFAGTATGSEKEPSVPTENADQNGEKAWSFYAYGASAATQEIVAVHFRQHAGGITGQVVQRESLGYEAAPLVMNTAQELVYVASLRAESGDNQLTVFSIGADGQLARMAEVQLAHGSAYLSLDRAEQFLLSASYFDGHVNVYRLDERGVPSELVHTQYEDRDKAHSILTTPDNRYAYVSYVSDQNGLFQYSFDRQSGRLQPLEPGQAEVPNGLGPRHVSYHPQLPLVFFSNEQQLGVTSYRIQQDGRLELLQVCSPDELPPQQGLAAADIAIAPDGRFLYVAVRDFDGGTGNSLHTYQVNGQGALTHLGATATDAIPWGLQFSPDGRYLLSTATDGGTLTVYEVGPNGGLTAQASTPWGKLIRDIVVAVK